MPSTPDQPHDPTPHARGGTPGRQPALKRTVVRPPAGITPDPVDAGYVANRLTTLTHELANLLDGSMRLICLARRSVDDAHGHPEEICADRLARQLETVHAAMAQMAGLVKSSMIGMVDGGLFGLREAFGSSSSLAEAVRHAVEVMSPIAEEHRVRLELEVAQELAHVAAGPVYAAITSGVRNAIESIDRLGGREGFGLVRVSCRTEAGRTGRCVVIEIADDGAGPPPDAALDPDAAFRLGYTTKPGGSGVGLALSRDIVHQLGGTIQLQALKSGPDGKRGEGPGAVLTIRYPVPRAMGGTMAG